MSVIDGVTIRGTDYDLADAQARSALETKAEIDGSYEGMTVGNAEQLLSTTYTEDSVPYLFRTSGGSADVGDREEDVIVGGSVIWNQLVKNGDFSDGIDNWTATSLGSISASNSVLKFTTTSSSNRTHAALQNLDIESGHKYFCTAKLKNLMDTSGTFAYKYTAPTYVNAVSATIAAGATSTLETVFSASGTSSQIGIGINANLAAMDVFEVSNVMLFDLTAMFGSSVADAIYSAEQASEGAGVKMFRSLFPKSYYAYDAGTLKSVEGLTAHKMVGFNQWDEEIEAGQYNSSTGVKESYSGRYRSKNFIPCLPDTIYYHNVPMQIFYYDSDKNFISVITGGMLSARTFTTPSNCHYMTFVVTEATKNTGNICINLSWSRYRNGEYEAYKEYEYPLDSTLTLRGLPKVDASGTLYYDGDRYLPDGTVERRYGVVDLGTLTWTMTDETNHVFRTTQLSGHVRTNYTNYICSGYPSVDSSASPADSSMPDKSVKGNTVNGGYFYVKDSGYSDAASLKTALSGVMLVYELETPTTESADPYQTPQIVDDFGTEEYVIDSQIAVPVPVGHETKYLANLRDKLQHLPDLASADGYYLIQQSGHDMSLVHFRIPQAPTADGTYTLKATVSGGTPTYTWEVVS